MMPRPTFRDGQHVLYHPLVDEDNPLWTFELVEMQVAEVLWTEFEMVSEAETVTLQLEDGSKVYDVPVSYLQPMDPIDEFMIIIGL